MRRNDNRQIKLARVITNLANERTILAYIRTSLTLLATGVAFQEIFHKPYVLLLGKLLVGLSVVILIVGAVSFLKIKKTITKQKESVPAQFLD
jgi:putative membrane protein